MSIATIANLYQKRNDHLGDARVTETSIAKTGQIRNLKNPAQNNDLFSGVRSSLQQVDVQTKPSMSAVLKSQLNDPTALPWNMIPNANFQDGKWNQAHIRFKKPPTQQQIENTKLILNKQSSLNDTLRYVSPLLSMVNNQLKKLGFGGIGNLTQSGSPLFMGRWYDAKTNRVKSFVKPKYIYNTSDYNAVMSHTLLNLVNKWNAFARAQDQAVALIRKQPNWRFIVQDKKTAQSIPKMRKTILKNIMQKIALGQVAAFNNSTPAEQNSVAKAFKTWNYNVIVDTLQQMGKVYLQKNPNLTRFQLQKANYFANLRTVINKRIVNANARLQFKGTMPLRDYKGYLQRTYEQNKADLNSDSSLQAYNARRRAVRRAYNTAGQIRQLASQQHGVADNVVVQLPTVGKNRFQLTQADYKRLQNKLNPKSRKRTVNAQNVMGQGQGQEQGQEQAQVQGQPVTGLVMPTQVATKVIPNNGMEAQAPVAQT